LKTKKNYKFSWITFSIIFTVVLIFLSEWIQKSGIIYFPSGFRHFLILSLFVVNWARFGNKIVNTSKYKIAIILMVSYLLVSYFFSSAPLLNYILGTGFTFLFLIVFILGTNTKSTQKIIIKIFNLLLIFIFLMSIVPIAQGIITGTNLRWLPGLFREVGAFATAMNAGTIIGLSLFIITSKKKYIYMALFFSFGILMTILKKTIISNVFVWAFFFLYFLKSKSKFKMIFYSIAFFIFALISFGTDIADNLNENQSYIENVGPEGHVRLGMYIASFNIAKDNFPFGSGMGTFGSLASIVNGYSEVYYEYNVSNIGSNSAQDVANGHHTLLDTYWPHIIAELGFFGFIIFVYLWIYPTRKAFKILNSSKTHYISGLCFYIVLTGLTITWEGFSLYTPEVPVFILLNFGLSGLCFYHIAKNINPINKS
jgi:hypothetical protein